MSFRFKQFSIQDDRCAMKVGTDGVLLGAWCPITNHQLPITHTPLRVLDVGTGSGLIARMLMQRCPEAEIEGIDIDSNAVSQAQENGINAFCASVQEWDGEPYDLIVSNPPFFQNSLKNPDKGRQTARHTDTLSYEELIAHSARLLQENGRLALILPAEAEEEVRRLAAVHNLFLTHLTRVFSKETKPARRVLMAFVKSPITLPVIEDTLVLEDEKGGRSLPYQELCREFYL